MVNVVLFPGNIELNHTVGVSDVVYCNSWVRFPRQLVIIAFLTIESDFNASAQFANLFVVVTIESTF